MSVPSSPLPKPSQREEEALFGAQAAARYLGLHRSTLFLAVREGILIPDARTRGKHTRFRRATLDAYKARYAAASATGETAMVPLLRTLSDLTRSIASALSLPDAARSVVEQVQRALPGIDGVSVARAGVTPGDPSSVQMITEPMVPEHVLHTFERLRHTFRFGTTTALRTLEAEISEDTSSENSYTGTRNIVRTWPLGAYAIYPIVVRGEARGLLFCTSSQPRSFPAADRAFLQAVVGLLTLAFERFEAIEVLRALGAPSPNEARSTTKERSWAEESAVRESNREGTDHAFG
jgi:excisionase family DNA binding protein